MHVFAYFLVLSGALASCLRQENPAVLGVTPTVDIPAKQGDLRVITYNLYCWNACPKGYDYVTAWLEKVLPTTDVIAFQEFECSECPGSNIRNFLSSTDFGGKTFKAVRGHSFMDIFVDTTATVTTSLFSTIGYDVWGARYVQTASVEFSNGLTLQVANHHGCLGSVSWNQGCSGGGEDAIMEELESQNFFEGNSIWLCDCNDMQHHMDAFCDYGFEYQKTKSGSLAGFDNIAWSTEGMTYEQAFQYDGKGSSGASDHQGLVVDLRLGFSPPCNSNCATCVEGSEEVCASCDPGKVLVDGDCTDGVCSEQNWPDLDHNRVCGDCKVLVDNFASSYGTCSGYCTSLGLACVGAWDEVDDTCQELETLTCDQTLSSSDAICECGPGDVPAPTPTDSTVCDTAAWPDLDHGLVCGECKVLVNNFYSTYQTCSGYCNSMDLTCKSGWEEVGDTCEELYFIGCDQTVESSDAICECNPPDTDGTSECGAEIPEECSAHIDWAQTTGRVTNPEWYGNFEEVTGVSLSDSVLEDMTLYFACHDTGHQECQGIEGMIPCGRSCLD